MLKITMLLSLFFSQQLLAEESIFTFTSGVDYSSGKYGDSQTTKITYIPFTAKYDIGRWSLKTTLPWLSIEGPGGVSADSRVVIDTNNKTTKTKESGQGDIVMGATFSAIALTEQQFYLDVNAKVKLPTASKKRGLGTGETDYALSTDLYQTFGAFSLLGTIGYRLLGDPAGIKLNNVWFGTVGGVYKINRANNVGLTLDLREATTNSGANLREYTLFYSHKFDDVYKLQTYVVYGDTSSSVDWGGGALLSVAW